MIARKWLSLPLSACLLVSSVLLTPSPACCPAPPSGQPVVNADQTVIIVWDAATQTQHFIRQASFKSDADDFGFLVPTPSPPDLEECGNDAFPFLFKLTAPETQRVPRPSGGMSCACSAPNSDPPPSAVRVLQEKLVAGFNAVVLEADSPNALVSWLEEHGYAFSPEIEAWAKPYVESGWKITALKVSRDKDKDTDNNKNMVASALRMSFQTDRPLFPYREPDYKNSAVVLGASHRLLRIYFLADARYQGGLTDEVAWTGQVVWADKLKEEDQAKTFELLRISGSTVPANWWLTEFEDNWPYQVAPADVYFSQSSDQNTVARQPVIEYISTLWPTDVVFYTIFIVLILRARRP